MRERNVRVCDAVTFWLIFFNVHCKLIRLEGKSTITKLFFTYKIIINMTIILSKHVVKTSFLYILCVTLVFFCI